MDIQQVERAVRVGRLVRPLDREGLRRWVGVYAGMHLPMAGVCGRHGTPLDYLEHVFFEREGEAVVWACRGGGKTMVGAVATLLDLLFKPGCQVRIIGGSREQSEKMYVYLCGLVERRFGDLILGRVTKKGFGLRNGSRVEILAQSAKAVRGTRVQKVRCDEIELFKEEVWKAVQLTTRSSKTQNAKHETRKDAERREEGEGESGDLKFESGDLIGGRVEVFSTMHVPGGVMQRIVTETQNAERETQNTKHETQNLGARRIFSWCVWDVMARCHARRRCEGCILWEGCEGRAKNADGFVPVEDVIAMRKRVTPAVWESEMLCYTPYLEERVFWGFREEQVMAMSLEHGQPGVGETVLAGERKWVIEGVVAGVDFGWKVFACLWMVMLRDSGSGEMGVWVVDEYVEGRRTLEQHAEAIKHRPMGGGDRDAWKPMAVHCDVAGGQHDAHSGVTSLGVLRKAGFVVKAKGMRVEEGIEVINGMMGGGGGNTKHETRNTKLEGEMTKDERQKTKALGGARFFVSPGCAKLILALKMYRREWNGRVVKDGEHDHLIDALRYGVMNWGGGGGALHISVY